MGEGPLMVWLTREQKRAIGTALARFWGNDLVPLTDIESARNCLWSRGQARDDQGRYQLYVSKWEHVAIRAALFHEYGGDVGGQEKPPQLKEYDAAYAAGEAWEEDFRRRHGLGPEPGGDR